MYDSETNLGNQLQTKSSNESCGCAGFPGEGRKSDDHILYDETVLHSFGEELELEFIDGVTELEIEDAEVESLLGSVFNTLTRKDPQCTRKGKK